MQPNIWLFLWCISVCHFCQLPSVFDLLSAAICSQGKSSSHAQGSGVGIWPLQLMQVQCELLPCSLWAATLLSPLLEHLLTATNTACPGAAAFFPAPLSGRHRLLIRLCYAMCLKCCTFCSGGILPLPNLLLFILS